MVVEQAYYFTNPNESVTIFDTVQRELCIRKTRGKREYIWQELYREIPGGECRRQRGNEGEQVEDGFGVAESNREARF